MLCTLSCSALDTAQQAYAASRRRHDEALMAANSLVTTLGSDSSHINTASIIQAWLLMAAGGKSDQHSLSKSEAQCRWLTRVLTTRRMTRQCCLHRLQQWCRVCAIVTWLFMLHDSNFKPADHCAGQNSDPEAQTPAQSKYAELTQVCPLRALHDKTTGHAA